MVRRPVDGEVRVAYHQIYVVSGHDDISDLNAAFAGQTAGLCGAAVPGFLYLVTGLHSGAVGFTIEVHGRAPALDAGWEEAVEVSYRPRAADARLTEWGGGGAWPLGLVAADYRVRYCASGMDRGQALDTRVAGAAVDRYLLQFWPALPAPDRILRQTSSAAASWHRAASELPPPPTAAERAERARRARAARERAAREQRLAHERWQWGGRLPSETLRQAEGAARGLLGFDAELVHALDAAGPEAQRRVAVLAAEHACRAAGIAALDWVAPALAALAEGRPLPPPFEDSDSAFRALRDDPRVPDRTVGLAVEPPRPVHPAPVGRRVQRLHAQRPFVAWVSAEPRAVASGPPGPVRVSAPHMALPAVVHAGGAEPLTAALLAVRDAVHTYGEAYPTLLRDVRAGLGAAFGGSDVSAGDYHR
ncbi:hypothetical protein RM844_16845 [Streptomyces sp. DSM 44915]|uniref:Uncharacterized protein n=1 Tax=Streptomyces chisholmiae TaxID=3075540 RepID=A0ABU2JSK5_9ACTN|nr:hypothetical protein [Streptomyces sp. DSM 44915]MDT0267950.1 hypothetical protein [Streptomyces sp. DSM 44915]